jgi:hypothetical protein
MKNYSIRRCPRCGKMVRADTHRCFLKHLAEVTYRIFRLRWAFNPRSTDRGHE